MSKTKYIARLDGVVVGTRRSDRTYTHAIVIKVDEEFARTEAYNYLATNYDLTNFNYFVEIADQGMQHEYVRPKSFRPDGDVDYLQHAAEIAEAGWDAYVASRKASAIETFESRKADGYYEPKVVAWAGRPDLAVKRAREAESPRLAWVRVVPAKIVPEGFKVSEVL
jgi:hypothetical protein